LKNFDFQIEQFCKKARLILVATKSDRREWKATLLVSSCAGKVKCKEIGALRHLECSSLQDFQVIGLLGEALKAVRRAKIAEKMKCALI
jgi:hypothetical protein